ncbi:MAG: aspartate aminotransferase family protein [Micromonosporaceae bacterium]|nr:aspartate aminotransferase family protein [Micromonosporaceae bacterium]
MTPEQFREHGHAAVDWVADYWERIEAHPVLSQVAPGDVARAVPPRPPVAGEPFEQVLADLASVVTPGLTHWQHPSHFGYFPANTSGPSVLADLVCAGLGVQGMLWATSPACTELETAMLDWLVDLLDLPKRFRSDSAGGGVIQDSASSATLVATLAALHRATDGAWGRQGVRGRHTIYTSTQGHSSIEKAARIAGIGDANVRLVDVDPATLAMRPEALRRMIEADRAAGALPTMVVATVGTTSTTAIDPVAAIGEVCRDLGVWLHVDAAYAGSAAVCPELRWTHAGVEHADSYCFDPHKWLLTGFDCDAFWVADRGELIQALSVLPEYLRNAATESGAVIDYRDWQVPLGRRFRALKLWFTMRWYGVEGLREHIRRGVDLAQQFAARVRADERFEVVAPHPLSLVCFRLRPLAGEGEAAADARNEELLRRLNASGRLYLTHTRVNDRHTLRMAIGAPATEERHVTAAWEAIQRTAAELLG